MQTTLEKIIPVTLCNPYNLGLMVCQAAEDFGFASPSKLIKEGVNITISKASYVLGNLFLPIREGAVSEIVPMYLPKSSRDEDFEKWLSHLREILSGRELAEAEKQSLKSRLTHLGITKNTPGEIPLLEDFLLTRFPNAKLSIIRAYPYKQLEKTQTLMAFFSQSLAEKVMEEELQTQFLEDSVYILPATPRLLNAEIVMDPRTRVNLIEEDARKAYEFITRILINNLKS